METVSLLKRIFIYIINALVFSAIGLAALLPFLLEFDLPLVWYIILGVTLALLLSLIINFLTLWFSKGYTFISFLFAVKLVGVEEKSVSQKQAIIRALCETLLIFAILDMIYLLKNRTERGVIDRLSDTFMIDLRK